MRIAAGNSKSLIEFGARRAQGPNGALLAAKYSFVGTFNSTSNTVATYLSNSQIK